MPVNRLPEDILSLIPTYLPSQKDRFWASFVCRRWRRTFLQRAELWSQLFLSKGEGYVKTLLERTKGSTLDIVVGNWVPAGVTTLLSSRTEQIKYLFFKYSEWATIFEFSRVIYGPLPLLNTLSINADEEDIWEAFDMIPPSSFLFHNAVNLKEFRFNSKSSQFMNHFAFPNLVSLSLDLSAEPSGMLHASQLLDFLGTSPMLRSVYVKIPPDISLSDIAQDRIVVLPNVEDFTLIANGCGPVYKIAGHTSCPSARNISFIQKGAVGVVVPEGIFPDPFLWNAIVCQHARIPAEEVTLEIKPGNITRCKLLFRSPDAAIIELCFDVAADDEVDSPSAGTHNEVFARATRAVRDHPHLANVRRLHICHNFLSIGSAYVSLIANDVAGLFRSVGPLDELTIYCCDLRPYLHPFLTNIPGGILADGPLVFPPVKKLTISHPVELTRGECMAMVELTKSQHTLGVPFGRMEIHSEGTPAEIEEELRHWVGSVESYYEELDDDYVPG